MLDEETVHSTFRGLLIAHAYPGRTQRGMVASGRHVLDLLMGAVWADAPVPPLVIDEHDAAILIEAAGRGTEARPELGATIVRVVDRTCPRSRVRLEGPGVDGGFETSLPLRPSELAARARACGVFPLGVDMVFLDVDGGITALPRSVRAVAI